MRRFRASLLMFLSLGLLLGSCGLPGQAQPTQAPIIIIASPVPQGNPPTAEPQPTAGSQAQPTQAAGPTQAASAPTQAPSGPAPTVPAGSASKGTVTFAFKRKAAHTNNQTQIWTQDASFTLETLALARVP